MRENLLDQRVFLICSVMVFCAVVSGCDNSLRWSEDVRLPDGRIVLLKRYQEFKGAYEIGSTPSESNYWFEFEHPDTHEIVRWSYNRDLSTVALMIENKEPYLLLSPAFGSSEFKFNCPNPPYFLFRYSKNTWHRIDLTKIPFKKLRSNMTHLPKYKREEIERNKNHRSVEQTQNSFISNHKPWFMDFTNLEQQSFGMANCDRQPDYLLASPSASQGKPQ